MNKPRGGREREQGGDKRQNKREEGEKRNCRD